MLTVYLSTSRYQVHRICIQPYDLCDWRGLPNLWLLCEFIQVKRAGFVLEKSRSMTTRALLFFRQTSWKIQSVLSSGRERDWISRYRYHEDTYTSLCGCQKSRDNRYTGLLFPSFLIEDRGNTGLISLLDFRFLWRSWRREWKSSIFSYTHKD